ncbi:ferritin-like domain-containing protein [Betaproteobacteria bacterium SCN2]|jgi:uncharacterized ferritin-like protein (DUF455 family)|nr:ferritin-like domain-containing protein [Betaproteobacteria bacterium SCN2]
MLRTNALAAIMETGIHNKLSAVDSIDLDAPIDSDAIFLPARPVPGRSNKPPLVPPAQLKKRSVNTTEGRASLIHALAHIEFNAVDLGLDIVWRFPNMPDPFYRDWARIAKEEALHFKLLSNHLMNLGYSYGDFPAHNGLWEMAEKTSDDILARLALVPRTLEARGLDVTPHIKQKLQNAGDHGAASILDIILRDEIGHVAAGNRWYRYVCERRGLDPVTTYRELAEIYRAPRLRGPYNHTARRAAGFDETELAELDNA